MIARKLSARGVASAWAGKRGTGSWSLSAVQKIVTNERHLGVLSWGRTGNVYRGGTRVEITRPDAEVVRVVRSELRIIDDDLWQRAQAKGDRARSSTGLSKTGGRPRFLLAGMARCGECGGPVRALHRRRGTVTIRAYGCAWRDERGPEACSNSIRRPVDVVDEAILGWVRENLLGEEGVERTLKRLKRLVESEASATTAPDTETTALTKELRSVEAEIGRLTTAIASGAGAIDAVIRALADRDRHAKELREALANARVVAAAPTLRWAEIEAAARARLADLRGLAAGDADSMREVLQRLIVGPLKFHPVRHSPRRSSFRVTGAVVGGRGLIASPEGTEQSHSPQITAKSPIWVPINVRAEGVRLRERHCAL